MVKSQFLQTEGRTVSESLFMFSQPHVIVFVTTVMVQYFCAAPRGPSPSVSTEDLTEPACAVHTGVERRDGKEERIQC